MRVTRRLTISGGYVDISPKTIKAMPIRYVAGLWSDTVHVADVGDEAAEFVERILT
jgi:hypothetical protein